MYDDMGIATPTDQENYLQQLKECIIKGWPENKDSIAQDLRPYWTF